MSSQKKNRVGNPKKNEQVNHNLVIYRIDKLEEKIDIIQGDTEQTLKFIKDNIFDPHTGLWAEAKLNSQFRRSATKSLWALFVSTLTLIGKITYDTLF